MATMSISTDMTPGILMAVTVADGLAKQIEVNKVNISAPEALRLLATMLRTTAHKVAADNAEKADGSAEQKETQQIPLA